VIKELRHRRILAVLAREGAVALDALGEAMPGVSRVTLRRDLTELEESGALRRTRGGAVLPDGALLRRHAPPARPATDEVTPEIENLAAVILPPVSGPGADALRREIGRSGRIFVAESAPQRGGIYLGPDNHGAGRALGLHAGAEAPAGDVHLLVVGHPDLSNTRARVEGFLEGYRAGAGRAATVIHVNGRGSYRPALRAVQDAFDADPAISVVMGVNDHAALAAIDAAETRGRAIAVYATGGESPDFVGRLGAGGALRAVAAYFPEIVGARAVEVIAHVLSGAPAPAEVITPHALITAATLDDYYAKGAEGRSLRPEAAAGLAAGPGAPPPGGRQVDGARIGFMPHYPAHDWYRNMAQAMRRRAGELGLELVVTAPHRSIANEISRLRRAVAEAALAEIRPGQTVILGEGEATRHMAEVLRRATMAGDPRLAGVSVITNALDILHCLEDTPAIKTILTGGEYQRADRCLVGPSLGALFDRMRADIAFLAPAGVGCGFGLSALDERLALAGRRFVAAARRVVALADHTALGADANHRIARIDEIDAAITDDGALPADRQALRAAGLDVQVAATSPELPGGNAPEARTPRQHEKSHVKGG